MVVAFPLVLAVSPQQTHDQPRRARERERERERFLQPTQTLGSNYAENATSREILKRKVRDMWGKLKQFDAYPKTLEDFRVKTYVGASSKRAHVIRAAMLDPLFFAQ